MNKTHTLLTLSTSTLLIVAIMLGGVLSVNAQTGQQFSSLQDGDLIRSQGNIDVYIIKIINEKYFKRLVLNPAIFESYGHLRWDSVKNVAQNVVDRFTTSNLVREVYSDGRPVNNNIYALFPEGDTGIKRLVVGGSYDSDSVYNINHLEAGENFYKTGAPLAQQEVVATPPTAPAPTPQPTQQPQQTYTNIYLVANVIQNTAQKRDNCSTDLLGLEHIVGDKLLIPDDVCIQYKLAPSSQKRGHNALGSYSGTETRGVIQVYTDQTSNLQEKQHTLLHELCHANQHYHLQRNNTYNWNNTPAGREFITITRYAYNEDKLPQYTLPENSIFLGKYGDDHPIELAADICAMLLSPALSTHRYSQASINTITSNTNILHWFNTYVLYNINSPQPVAPLTIHSLTPQEKQDIYNDMDLVINTLANGTGDPQTTLQLALYMIINYNEQARRYALSLIPDLLISYTTPALTNSADLTQQIQARQSRLNELRDTISALKVQINTMITQGVQVNDIVSRHNALVTEYNTMLGEIQAQLKQLQAIQNAKIKTDRATLATSILTEWLGELIETGEV